MKRVIILIFILGISIGIEAAVKNTDNGIEFIYDAPQASVVYLVGSFNDWNSENIQMEQDKNGVWHTTLDLEPGEYQYKYVVDGNWYYDPDHTNLADDGYGGSNSLVVVGEDGKLAESVTAKKELPGVPSYMHPKVFFTGRYYSKNIFKHQKDRFMLDKPEHDIDLGFKIKLNNKFEGFTLLNVNNNAEGTDMWKTHLNYKKAYLKLDAEYFTLNGFDDVGVYTSDDPLQMIGNIGKYNYDLGYGYRGVMMQTSSKLSDKIFQFYPVLDLEATVIYADKAGDDETDIEAGRFKLNYLFTEQNNNKTGLQIGGLVYNARLKPSNKLLQKHNSFATDLSYYTNFYQPGWLQTMKTELQAEYYSFENLDEYQNYSTDTTVVKKDFTWMEGKKYYLGGKIDFPAALSVNFSYENTNLDFHIQTGIDTISVTPSPFIKDSSISKNQYHLGADLQLGDLNGDWQLEYWQINFPNSNLSWEDYYNYLEKTNGNGRWYQQYSEVPFEKYTLIGYEKGLLWKTNWQYDFDIMGYKTQTSWQGSFAHSDFLKEPKFIENILELTFDLNAKWQLYSNTRLPIYNDEILGLETKIFSDDDLFVSNYTSINYSLARNVKLSLGWGVNPRVLNTVTNKFYEGGREEFLEDAADFAQYVESTYIGIGNKIRQAEEKLKRASRIGLEATITF